MHLSQELEYSLLPEAGALVMCDGEGGLQTLQVLTQAVVFAVQLNQLRLPCQPPPLQLPPFFTLALDLPSQVGYHCFQGTCSVDVLHLDLAIMLCQFRLEAPKSGLSPTLPGGYRV